MTYPVEAQLVGGPLDGQTHRISAPRFQAMAYVRGSDYRPFGEPIGEVHYVDNHDGTFRLAAVYALAFVGRYEDGSPRFERQRTVPAALERAPRHSI